MHVKVDGKTTVLLDGKAHEHVVLQPVVPATAAAPTAALPAAPTAMPAVQPVVRPAADMPVLDVSATFKHAMAQKFDFSSSGEEDADDDAERRCQHLRSGCEGG